MVPGTDVWSCLWGAGAKGHPWSTGAVLQDTSRKSTLSWCHYVSLLPVMSPEFGQSICQCVSSMREIWRKWLWDIVCWCARHSGSRAAWLRQTWARMGNEIHSTDVQTDSLATIRHPFQEVPYEILWSWSNWSSAQLGFLKSMKLSSISFSNHLKIRKLSSSMSHHICHPRCH